jgi:hypothetical protein
MLIFVKLCSTYGDLGIRPYIFLPSGCLDRKDTNMSQWTHVLGIIRFDSSALNVYPVPVRKTEILKKELDLVSKIYKAPIGAPTGSEGGLHLSFYISSRGPTVSVTGDLRDFGVSDIETITDWLNKCDADSDRLQKGSLHPLFLRDAFIRCEVEYHPDYFIIVDDPSGIGWKTITCPKPIFID